VALGEKRKCERGKGLLKVADRGRLEPKVEEERGSGGMGTPQEGRKKERE
jgi:hypothetical protein